MPVVPSDFEYQFSPSALKKVRDRLSLSQAHLAEILDLPVNTVSRWERGETTPDANSLAAIYSIGKRRGIEPEFFERVTSLVNTKRKDPRPLNGRKILNRQRTRLVMLWDFQNVALDSDDAYDAWFYLDKYLDIAFPKVDDWALYAYATWQQRDAVEKMRYVELKQVGYNADSQIKQEARTLCGIPETSSIFGFTTSSHDPKDTVLILVSKDCGFADLILGARQAGVDVYVWAPPEGSQELIGATNRSNVIPWNHPCIVVSEDNLRRLKQ